MTALQKSDGQTGHTSGPWLAQREQGGGYAVWTRQPHTGTLATIHEEDINGAFPAEANARLIAAAPELFAALISLIPSNVALGNDAWPDSTVLPLDVTLGELRKARSAISKATGASS